MVKVSICIPTYNQTALLKKTLDSIVAQKFDNYEIVVTDDSTNEEVKQLLSKYDFHGKMKYRRNIRRLGSPGNWNEAMKLASGEYIKIMHHDDWFVNEHSLGKFANALESNPESILAFSQSTEKTDGSTYTKTTTDIMWLTKNTPYKYRDLLISNIIGAPSATIFRKNANLFDNKLMWLVDVEYYIRLGLNKDDFTYISETLVVTSTTSENRVTNSCNKKTVELREWLYVYDLYWHNRLFSIRECKLIRSLFEKYDIKKISEIESMVDRVPNRLTLRLLIYINGIMSWFKEI